MSLRPFLSSTTSLPTPQAIAHVRHRANEYARWLKRDTLNGVVPCPTCWRRLDQPRSGDCPECSPYRRARR